MIFIINLTRGQMRFLTCVARVTCIVLLKVVSHYGLRVSVRVCDGYPKTFGLGRVGEWVELSPFLGFV